MKIDINNTRNGDHVEIGCVAGFLIVILILMIEFFAGAGLTAVGCWIVGATFSWMLALKVDVAIILIGFIFCCWKRK